MRDFIGDRDADDVAGHAALGPHPGGAMLDATVELRERYLGGGVNDRRRRRGVGGMAGELVGERRAHGDEAAIVGAPAVLGSGQRRSDCAGAGSTSTARASVAISASRSPGRAGGGP